MSSRFTDSAVNEQKPLFIVLEGIDGSGKSTQGKILKEYLESKNIPCILTREPGGTLLAEHLRKIILDPSIELNDRSELLLFMASRAAHVNEIIKSALEHGKTVICDRFYLSTFAYQGYGRGLNLNDIATVNDFASYGLKADLTFIFDIDAERSLVRTGKEADRFEDAGNIFMEKVAEGYRELAKQEKNCYLLDADLPIEEIAAHVQKILVNTVFEELK